MNQSTSIQVEYTSVHRFLIAVTVTRAERGVMVLNATFNAISVISWRSVLSVEETEVSGENHRPFASHWQTWSHNVVSSTPRLSGVRTHNISSDKGILHHYFFIVPIVMPCSFCHGFFFIFVYMIWPYVAHLHVYDCTDKIIKSWNMYIILHNK
jgi:hypothetical protein